MHATTPTLLIVGHGMATQRLLQNWVASGGQARTALRIQVLGDEPHAAYNRIMLSSVLAGEAGLAQLPLATDAWYAQHGIEVISGDPAIRLDRATRKVHTLSGRQLSYDRLIIGTGSRPAALGVPGEDLPGVIGFRTLADTQALLDAARQHRRAVVIGGGFLGLEAAEGLRKQGMTVTLLHRSSHLLNRQLDAAAGALLADDLSQRGLRIHLNTRISGLLGRSRVRAVELADGSVISTDLVVIAAGITPNVELGRDAGLICEHGLCVDSRLSTSDPRIHALGECAQFGPHTWGLVEPLYRQADILSALLHGETAQYREAPVATRLKISGINLFSCGRVEAGADTESIIYHDREHGIYRHLLLRDQRLVGAVLYGDTRDGPWYFDQLQRGADIAPWRAQLAFGEPFCQAAA
ncbi:MAG: FAD-dependent oxidoreductase [Gammaproteobacteria bacterium]|nr:FAD-dependent oxidoreductase [Gammaproteobacteria bacterium]